MREYGFTDISMKLYFDERIFNADEYIEYLDTMPDHRNLPENDRTALYSEIKNVIQKYGGQHKQDYTFQLYMGRKP